MTAIKITVSLLMIIFGTVFAGTASKSNAINYLDNTNWPKDRVSKNSGFQFWGGVGVVGAGLVFLVCTLHELNEENKEVNNPTTSSDTSSLAVAESSPEVGGFQQGNNIIPFPDRFEEPPVGQPLNEDEFDSLLNAKLNQKVGNKNV